MSAADVHSLVSPLGGLIGRVTRLPGTPGGPDFPVFSASLGDVGQALPSVAASAGGRLPRGHMDGAGGALEPERARLLCVAEALERYCSCVYDPRQFRVASAAELAAEGEDAIDLAAVPRCSERELAHPACPVRAPDPSLPLRWVRGVSLVDLRPRWVPAVMVYMHITPGGPGEAFCLPISTGCAAHVDVRAALVNALCEVIERDAISLTWLQALALPQIAMDEVPPELARALARAADSHVETRFFDATTDLGIPTVYSVDLAEDHPTAATVVMCATDLDPARAAAKVLRESASSRIALSVPRDVTDDLDAFHTVFDGAVYMGAPERRPAFAFLLDSPRRRRFSELPVLATGDPAADLALLVDRLRTAGMDAVAVDLTTDEALRVGFRVVRVVVPQLQPLSFTYRARYLGHPRLSTAPARMGHPVRPEEEINPWPQPFA